jgi:diguanylate cyclase (GGDEF)-like protein
MPMYTSPNLNTLHFRVEPAISRALANALGFAVLVSHLDRLKDVYEALGRAGAGLLRKVGDRWSAALQGRSAVWSLGGGEYALLIPGTNADVASRVANRLLCALERPFDIHGAAVQVGGSIGAAVYPEHGKNADTLLRNADIAASEAAQSPTGYAIYVPNEDRISPQRLALAADLRQAIEQDQLVLHYQPQVETSSGALTSVEALVRWDHPLRGRLSPDQFIPLAEQTRLIRPLSRFVLRAALKQSREWQLQGRFCDVGMG